jgi:hypothetical protein
MASYAVIRPSQLNGLYKDPMMSLMAANPPSPTWQDGGLLAFTSGLLVSAQNAAAVNTVIGVAASASVLNATTAGGNPIGLESQSAVGAGSAIVGVRRTFYAISPLNSFTGSIDTSGSQGATALSVTDIGTAFKLQSVNAAGALTNNAFWILDRTGGGNLTAVVTRLIDPPGAKFGDTPIPGINSGQALVEFTIVGRIVSLI